MMFVNQFGTWQQLAAVGLGYLLGAVGLLAAAWIAMLVIKKVFGEANYSALTTVVAVIGSIVAISQFRSTARAQEAAQARSLAFVTGLTEQAIDLSTVYPAEKPRPGQSVAGSFILDPAHQAERFWMATEASTALEAVDPKDLPDSAAMVALIRSRAAMKGFVAQLAQGLKSKQPVDASSAAYDLSVSLEALTKERDRLYPLYHVGKFQIASDVDRQ